MYFLFFVEVLPALQISNSYFPYLLDKQICGSLIEFNHNKVFTIHYGYIWYIEFHNNLSNMYTCLYILSSYWLEKSTRESFPIKFLKVSTQNIAQGLFTDTRRIYLQNFVKMFTKNNIELYFGEHLILCC